MKVKIAFDCNNAEFDYQLFDEIDNVLAQAFRKIKEQASRKSGCICNHPESADILLDSNGNTIGTVELIND
jgi:hypothetical protein